MVTLSEVIQSSENQAEVIQLRKKFHKSRADYELGLRKFILNEVNNCPCCFKGLSIEAKDSIKRRAFYSDFEPDEFEVLEDMYLMTTQQNEEDE